MGEDKGKGKGFTMGEEDKGKGKGFEEKGKGKSKGYDGKGGMNFGFQDQSKGKGSNFGGKDNCCCGGVPSGGRPLLQVQRSGERQEAFGPVTCGSS